MKKNIGQLTSDVFGLLDGQDKEDAIKILASVANLLGLDVPKNYSSSGSNSSSGAEDNQGAAVNFKDAKKFFSAKEPKTRGEEFAVAAKFRVDNNLGDTHTKEDLKTIIKTQAKRSFNDHNFPRDMDNAIRQAKLFISGDKRGEYILADVGEDFVDALPDREAANATRQSRKKTVRKKSQKKATKK